MPAIVALTGTLMAVLGVLGLVRPAVLIEVTAPFRKARSSLYLASGIRLLVGIALIQVAPESRFPQALRILGWLLLGIAVLILLLGSGRLSRLADWWMAASERIIRVWSLVTALLGVLLLYSVS
jgi:hypothetical protein